VKRRVRVEDKDDFSLSYVPRQEGCGIWRNRTLWESRWLHAGGVTLTAVLGIHGGPGKLAGTVHLGAMTQGELKSRNVLSGRKQYQDCCGEEGRGEQEPPTEPG
jgi:hypothetical protein